MTTAKHIIAPTGVKLPPELKLRLKTLGEFKKRSIHWLMKDAIERYIEEEEHTEKLKQETLSRWHEAELDKVVSDEAVTAWLDTWGSDEEGKRPLCGS